MSRGFDVTEEQFAKMVATGRVKIAEEQDGAPRERSPHCDTTDRLVCTQPWPEPCGMHRPFGTEKGKHG